MDRINNTQLIQIEKGQGTTNPVLPVSSDRTYYYCQGNGCKNYSKHIRSMIKFKGKLLCHWCKLKASKQTGYLPPLNPSEAVVKKYIKLSDIGIDAKKLERKPCAERKSMRGFLKVTEPLVSWANKIKERNREARNGFNKIIQVGLTKDEHKSLWIHFSKQGLSDEQIDIEINNIKNQIVKAHAEYKQGLKLTKPTFKEEFTKLISK